MASGKTIAGIQYLRAIAAIFVVMEHGAKMSAMPQYLNMMPAAIYRYGHFGVCIFFVISGFIIATVSLNNDLTPRISSYEYARRRLTRIIPFLWVCVILYYMFRFAGTGQTDILPSIRAMFIWPIGELRPNVTWTLRHEFIFYTIFAVAFLQNRQYKYILVIWCLAPIVFILLCRNGMCSILLKNSDIFEITTLIFSLNNLFFGAGFLMGVLYLRRGSQNFKNLGLKFIICASLISLVIVNQFDDLFVVDLALATFLVWLGIGVMDQGGLAARAGHLLGDASYSIYLVHNLAFLIMLPVAKAIGAARAPLAAHFFMTILAILFGVVTHSILEKPIVTFAGRLGRRPGAAKQ